MTRALWPLVLVAMVAVTATCTVLYLLAPFDPPQGLGPDEGLPGLVEPEHRITVLTAEGDLAVYDERTDALSEIALSGLSVDPATAAIAVGAHHEVAYVVRSREGGPEVVEVSLKKGKVGEVVEAPATWPAVGRLQHPKVPRTRRGPEVELLAYGSIDGAGFRVDVENVVTGATQRFPAEPERTGIGSLGGLEWDGFANELYVNADGGAGAGLWVLATDRDHSLADAERVGPDPVDGDTAWVGVASMVRGLAVVQRTASGTELVGVDRSGFQVTGPLLDEPIGDVTWIDADAEQRQLLIVTVDGTLYRWDSTSGDGPRRLAEGVLAAAW